MFPPDTLHTIRSIVDAIFLAFFIITAFWVMYEYKFNKTGVPTIATLPRMRRAMIARLQQGAAAYTGKPYQILDLGSGNGQLTRAIACAIPTAQVIGIEISYLPWLRATWMQKLFGPANLTYIRRDFWSYDCGTANAVVLYLVGKKMAQIGTKLRQELKPGGIVLSNRYALLGDWPTPEVAQIRTPFKGILYTYHQT